jgi:hypothetical protein
MRIAVSTTAPYNSALAIAFSISQYLSLTKSVRECCVRFVCAESRLFMAGARAKGNGSPGVLLPMHLIPLDDAQKHKKTYLIESHVRLRDHNIGHVVCMRILLGMCVLPNNLPGIISVARSCGRRASSALRTAVYCWLVFHNTLGCQDHALIIAVVCYQQQRTVSESLSTVARLCICV